MKKLVLAVAAIVVVGFVCSLFLYGWDETIRRFSGTDSSQTAGISSSNGEAERPLQPAANWERVRLGELGERSLYISLPPELACAAEETAGGQSASYRAENWTFSVDAQINYDGGYEIGWDENLGADYDGTAKEFLCQSVYAELETWDENIDSEFGVENTGEGRFNAEDMTINGAAWTCISCEKAVKTGEGAEMEVAKYLYLDGSTMVTVTFLSGTEGSLDNENEKVFENWRRSIPGSLEIS